MGMTNGKHHSHYNVPVCVDFRIGRQKKHTPISKKFEVCVLKIVTFEFVQSRTNLVQII